MQVEKNNREIKEQITTINIPFVRAARARFTTKTIAHNTTLNTFQKHIQF